MAATTTTMPSFYFHKHFFQRIFPGKPFFVQVFSAGVLAATGDILCQKFIEKRDKWDPFRTSRFALTTAIVIAPIQFHWFRFMDRRIGNPKRVGPAGKVTLQTGLKRVLVDQSLIAPALTAVFLFSVNFLDSFSTQNAIQRTKRIYLDVLINSYKFWPFVQIVNLTVIPLHFRVVFLQFFGIFWNIFLSFKTNN
ncbi:hypothetical protein niasHS_006266 [Heterodera schachtii]|uniref:Mitochondrial inner membrane protein Mpv17 n=1 Tax=Heterodera schachtii TaxID=97005 RepID=A0ABD2JSW0_HETSC